MGTCKSTMLQIKGSGRKYREQDFQRMSDYSLFCKVCVFVDALPWKDRDNRKDVFTMLGMAERSIKKRGAEKAEPQEEGRKAA